MTAAQTPSSSWTWATITAVSPLRVRLDGDVDALPLTPSSLAAPTTLGVGKRVWVQRHGRRVVIIGVNNGGA